MSTLRRVDVDLRALPFGVEPLVEYLPRSWVEYLNIGADLRGSGTFRFALPVRSYWTPEERDRQPAIANPFAEAQAHLDRDEVDVAVLSPTTAAAIGGLSYPVFACELAGATNDWTAAEWLDREPRFRGSILVSPRDPARAVAEIERWGEDDRFVQVVLGHPPGLLGDRGLQHIYRAAAEHRLPVVFQAGGGYTGLNRGPSGPGDPGSMFELRSAVEYEAQPHILSLIGSGTLEAFPDLVVILTGFGVGWLPSLLARMDDEFHAGRVEPPAKVSRLPSEVARAQLRLTTAGLPSTALAPVDADLAAQVLVYSAGYPRPTDVAAALRPLTGQQRRAIEAENAARLYRFAERDASLTSAHESSEG